MIGIADYLRLLPKTELHCHFTSTMDAARFVQLADRYGVRLPTTDRRACLTTVIWKSSSSHFVRHMMS